MVITSDELLKPFVLPAKAEIPTQERVKLLSPALAIKLKLKRKQLVESGSLLLYQLPKNERFYTLKEYLPSPTPDKLLIELPENNYLVWTFVKHQVVRVPEKEKFLLLGSRGELITYGNLPYIMSTVKELEGENRGLTTVLTEFPRFRKEDFYPTLYSYWKLKLEQLKSITE